MGARKKQGIIFPRAENYQARSDRGAEGVVEGHAHFVGNHHFTISFSLAPKALFLGLTLVGHASLWLAIMADTGATLLVLANSLRLLHDSPP